MRWHTANNNRRRKQRPVVLLDTAAKLFFPANRFTDSLAAVSRSTSRIAEVMSAPYGTVTGRFSGGRGPNMQTLMPKTPEVAAIRERLLAHISNPFVVIVEKEQT